MNVEQKRKDELKHILATLQYALETFEETCQCGECFPCTRGQTDIRTAIEYVQEIASAAARDRTNI